jgi:hypothetical protein
LLAKRFIEVQVDGNAARFGVYYDRGKVVKPTSGEFDAPFIKPSGPVWTIS